MSASRKRVLIAWPVGSWPPPQIVAEDPGAARRVVDAVLAVLDGGAHPEVAQGAVGRSCGRCRGAPPPSRGCAGWRCRAPPAGVEGAFDQQPDVGRVGDRHALDQHVPHAGPGGRRPDPPAGEGEAAQGDVAAAAQPHDPREPCRPAAVARERDRLAGRAGAVLHGELARERGPALEGDDVARRERRGGHAGERPPGGVPGARVGVGAGGAHAQLRPVGGGRSARAGRGG